MSGEPTIVMIGNLTADPEMRFTQNGLAVANFTLAQTPRVFDRAKNEYVDGEAVFMRCSIWRDYAEHVAASLHKGMQVIAQGNLKQRSYETKEGEKRTSLELEVTDIGPTLRFATVTVERSGSRTQSNNRADQRGQQQEQQWYAPGQAPQQAPQQAGWQQPPQGQPTQMPPQQYAQPQQQIPADNQPMYQQPAQQPPAQPQQQVTSQGLWQPDQGDAGIQDVNAPF